MKNTWWIKYLGQTNENGRLVYNYKINPIFIKYIQVKCIIQYFINKLK